MLSKFRKVLVHCKYDYPCPEGTMSIEEDLKFSFFFICRSIKKYVKFVSFSLFEKLAKKYHNPVCIRHKFFSSKIILKNLLCLII